MDEMPQALLDAALQNGAFTLKGYVRAREARGPTHPDEHGRRVEYVRITDAPPDPTAGGDLFALVETKGEAFETR